MRRFWLLLILALPLAALVATAPLERAAEQAPPEEPAEADEAPVAPEKLGRLTLTLNPGGHTAVVEKVFFTPDSKQLITLGLDHCIHIWDVATGDAVKTLYPPGFGGLSAAALAPDGKRLAVASIYQDGEKQRHLIYFLTLPEGRIERPPLDFHTTKILSLSFSGDGKRLASGSEDGTICLWNPHNPDQEKPERVERITKRALNGLHEKAAGVKTFVQPRKLALSPDGSLLAGLDKINFGFILDLKPAQAKVVKKIEGTTHIAWSPDGQTLATTSIGYNYFKLWTPQGDLRTIVKGKGFAWIAFTRDKQDTPAVLVAWSQSNDIFHATLFEVASGKVLRNYDPKGVPNAKGTYPPGGKAIASSVNHDGAVSPDGRYVATGGASVGAHPVYLWKMADGLIHKRMSARNWIIPAKGAWSADGKSIAWDINHKTPSFHLGDLQLGRPIWEDKIQRAVLKQPDGDLSLKKDKKYEQVDVLKAGKRVARLELGDRTIDATFLGKDQVAVSGTKAAHCRLFDATTGKVLRHFAPMRANSLAPSPDGRFLLAVSHVEQSVRIYTAERDKPLLSLFVQGPDWVVWTPEGYYAATPGGERLMGWTVDNGIKEMPTFYAAERFRKDLYRPDVIKLLLEKGSLKDALATANAALRKEGKNVPKGVADPNKLLPPRAWLEILDRTNLPKVKVKVAALAAVPNQPITALRLLIDGRPVAGEGVAEFKVQDRKLAFNDVWTITLPGEKAAGPYQLTVLARGPDTSSLSAAVAVAYVNPAKLPVMHVLAVGINKYKDKPLHLDAARPDAEAIAANFQKCAQGELFRKVFPQTLLDKEATRPAILEALGEVRKKVKANDLVVVFFAGHGLKNRKGFYLFTAEANITNEQTIDETCLPGPKLRKTLGDFPCQVLLMLDACHSGAFGSRPKDKGVLGDKGFKPATDDLTRELTEDDVGVAVMCAAMGHEKAQEYGGHGLFTQAVVDALNKAPGVPFNPYNHELFIHHLHSYVLDQVAERSGGEQHPFLSLPWVVESFPVVKFAKRARAGGR